MHFVHCAKWKNNYLRIMGNGTTIICALCELKK
jgi:hypothetical protein